MDEQSENKSNSGFYANLNPDGSYTVTIDGVSMKVKDIEALVELIRLMNC